jgi:hypothetical protein
VEGEDKKDEKKKLNFNSSKKKKKQTMANAISLGDREFLTSQTQTTEVNDDF